jgi:hypothetical protein
MRFVAGKVADKAAEDAETVTRVRAMLQGYYAATGPGAMVAVTHVLDLLDPRGMWSLDPGQRMRPQDSAKGPPPEKDPRADPMTGCLPVTPEE